MEGVLTAKQLEIKKTLFIDALERGTASEIKKCLYVLDEDIIEEFNCDDIVKSFDLAVDRRELLDLGWWLGPIDKPVYVESVNDLVIAKIRIIDKPTVSDYMLEGIHVDYQLPDDITKHAVFLAGVDALVPSLGKYIAKMAAVFIREQIIGQRKYLVCSTNALLLQNVDDIKSGRETFSVNMGNRFRWKVDYEKTREYTGLCFYKI